MKRSVVVLVAGVLCVGVAGAWLATRQAGQDSSGNLPSNAGLSQDRLAWCRPGTNTGAYVSAASLQKLDDASRATGGLQSIGVSAASASSIKQAMKVGPDGAFYAARLLRDATMLVELDRMARCEKDGGAQCKAGDEIAHLKTETAGDPNTKVSWATLADQWRAALAQDIDISKHCVSS